MPTDRDDTLNDKVYAELLKLIHKQTGITIGDNRKSMVLSRLRKRLRANQLANFDGYLELVKSDADELQQFVDNMTTNKTYFHRTPRIWSYLEKTFIPDWIAAGHRRPIGVWSVASSTGEEAHTAGIFLEEFRSKHPGFDYKVFGTDVSSEVIETAQAGVYPTRMIQRFRSERPELFQKYMTGSDAEGFRVTSDITRRIKFKHHNLFNRLIPPSRFDIVLIRNVLIYFTHEDQERAIRNVERHMHPGGTMIIGESETLSPLKTNFESTEPLVYHHRDTKAGKAA